MSPYYTYFLQPHDFVQIVNISRQHWVCASYANCPPDVVDVNDSDPVFSTASYTLQKQITEMIKTLQSSFQMQIVNVQCQRGSSDSFHYCLYYCNLWWYRFSPSHLWPAHDDVEKMNCFPSAWAGRLGQSRFRAKKEVNTHCRCRLPWRKGENTRGDLIQCPMCNEWYHQCCEQVDTALFDPPKSYKW